MELVLVSVPWNIPSDWSPVRVCDQTELGAAVDLVPCVVKISQTMSHTGLVDHHLTALLTAVIVTLVFAMDLPECVMRMEIYVSLDHRYSVVSYHSVEA